MKIINKELQMIKMKRLILIKNIKNMKIKLIK